MRLQVRLVLLPLSVVAVLASACGDDFVDDLETDESELATLEYDQTAGGAISCDYVQGIPGSNVGSGCFQKSGDQFGITDNSSDSRRVGVYWKLGDGSRRGICFHTDGAGTSGHCNKDLPEGATVNMRSGTCNKTAANSCARPNGEGWSWSNWGSVRNN